MTKKIRKEEDDDNCGPTFPVSYPLFVTCTAMSDLQTGGEIKENSFCKVVRDFN